MNNQTALLAKGLWLEYITLCWNAIGCGLLLWAAFAAKSVALAGFGVDSVIEILASVVVIWQLKAINKDKEKPALRLIGTAFFLLATYIVIQSGYALLTHVRAVPSIFGMTWLLLTLVVMLWLAHEKARIGTLLNHSVLRSEAKVTLVDALLAGAVLAGLALNYIFSWWWADSLASLVIVFYVIKEGWRAFKEQ